MPPAALTCPMCQRSVPAPGTHCPHDGTPLRADAMAFDDETVRRSPRSNFASAGLSSDPDADTDEGDAGGGEPTHTGDSLIGAQLGDYVVQRRLGNGGMGVVYAGEQPLIGKKVAIKVLRDEIARDPVQIKRLLDEARAVNSIRHRGIIDIFNFGELPDGRHYVVMEYLEGEALDQFLERRGALPVGEAIELLDEILAALGAGHGVGIIHRDFKPSNVFLVRQPDGSHYLKLLDFGLAKQAPAGTNISPQTHTHLVVGTPEYMAPEQAQAKPVSPRTDLYAAGVVMFEMLTGRHPFDARTPMEWMIRHIEEPAPAPSSRVGGIPKELDALILRMLEKEPDRRHASAEAVRRELQRITRAMSREARRLADVKVEPTLPGASKGGAKGPSAPAELWVTGGRKARPLLLSEPAPGAGGRPAVNKRIRPVASFSAPEQPAAPKARPKLEKPDEPTAPWAGAASTIRMPSPPKMRAHAEPMPSPPPARTAKWAVAIAAALGLIGVGVLAYLFAR